MALTPTQLVTVAEITQETYETVESLASSLITEQETLIIADIATWNSNRDKVKVEMEGGSSGVSYKAKRLLSEIRMRVRNQLGLSPVSMDTVGYSQSVATSWIV